MVLTTDAYDAAYFGDVEASGGLKHIAGYSDYKRTANMKNRTDNDTGLPVNSLRSRYEKLLESQSLVGRTVVELGGGMGHLGAWGLSKGINWTVVDVSPWCNDNKVVPPANFVLSDALTYLQTLSNKSVDVIVSSRFLVCYTDADIQILIDEIKRVARVKQVHIVDESANPTFYTRKTLEQWEADFNWPKNKVVLISVESRTVVAF